VCPVFVGGAFKEVIHVDAIGEIASVVVVEVADQPVEVDGNHKIVNCGFLIITGIYGICHRFHSGMINILCHRGQNIGANPLNHIHEEQEALSSGSCVVELTGSGDGVGKLDVG